MKLKCIIVDDEPIARKLLAEYIEEIDYLELAGSAENPLKAVSLLADLDIDLVFLDINMPKMSGMDFLKSAANLPMIILTTAYGQYALEGFELAVVDYLVKPFSLERFVKATQKALELKKLRSHTPKDDEGSAGYFYVKCDGKIERVGHDELLYVEAMANYVILHTNSRKLIAYLTIKGILEKLPAWKFIRVHKSIIVNATQIKSIEGNMLHIGDTKITVSANFQNEAMNGILKDKLIKR